MYENISENLLICRHGKKMDTKDFDKRVGRGVRLTGIRKTEEQAWTGAIKNFSFREAWCNVGCPKDSVK